MGLGIAHQARGVHEREADSLAVVGELLAVEVGTKMALAHRDARGAGQRVHPVTQILDDEVAHRAWPVVELERGRHEWAAAGKARRLLPCEPALEQGADAGLAAPDRQGGLDDGFDHPGARTSCEDRSSSRPASRSGVRLSERGSMSWRDTS